MRRRSNISSRHAAQHPRPLLRRRSTSLIAPTPSHRVVPDESMSRFLTMVVGRGHERSGFTEGLRAYLAYADGVLTLPKCDTVENLVQGMTPTTDPNEMRQQIFTIASQILSILKSSSRNRVSIEQLVENIYTAHEIEAPQKTQLRQLCRHTVFHVIGIGSMLYSSNSVNGANLFQVENGRLVATNITHENAQRPLFTLLRQLGCLKYKTNDFGMGNPSTVQIQDTKLDATYLSMSVLRSLGRIWTVTWVDSLDRHLQFEPESKRLSVFRFPSLCCAALLNKEESILAWWLNEDSTASTHPRTSIQFSEDDPAREFIQELLSTYWLLFGQDRHSRKIFRAKERPHLIRATDYDPLLDELCGSSSFIFQRPELAQVSGNLKTIFRSSEFPIYGKQLCALHEHISKQRPKRLLDLYRDRRDSEKFYTFWAVIIFGTAAMLLGTAQVAVSAAQLAIAIRQLHQPQELS